MTGVWNKTLFVCFLLVSTGAYAKTQVLVTTTDLAAITKAVGGDAIDVDTICKGTQDPHSIEAKPSFMIKASRADLVISVGLGLETGWLPSILRGARNPKILSGVGNLEVGPLVNPIEVPTGAISRSQGDVHPEGNPHFTLDPNRAVVAAEKIAERLGQLDSGHKKDFDERSRQFKDRMSKKIPEWKARIAKTGIKEVVTYHRALNYFLSAFDIQNPIVLEPKPGIPPTSQHILDVIRSVKEKKIPLILIENFFDHAIANRIKEESPQIRIVSTPVSVEGAPGITTLEDLYERLVQIIEGK